MPRLTLLGVSFHVLRTLLLGGLLAVLVGIGAMVPGSTHASDSQSAYGLKPTSKAQANKLIQRQPGFFVPNLGQWDHPAKFVHRSGAMTLFLEDRGWVLDLVERPAQAQGPHQSSSFTMPPETPLEDGADLKIRGAALKMTFAGDTHVPQVLGENKLPGHHSYFLGNDETRWRTGVPLYGSVRYQDLYPGIDVRLREANGVPEYDLLLQPGADLSLVGVHVGGAKRLSLASNGSLVIDTALGPVTQPKPKTWHVDHKGEVHEVACHFTLLGANRFGFEASGWDGDTSLTIDPGLIWSTFLGGKGSDSARAVSVDARGVVTVAGSTRSAKFPTTSGAYDTSYNSADDVFVSRLDPSKTGSAQLVYSTFLSGAYQINGLVVEASGVVTIAGYTESANFPTTKNAYDTTYNGRGDAFLSRLDPSKSGNAQLVYSTVLGGSGQDHARALAVDSRGVATLTGFTDSYNNFPTTSGAYNTTPNGRTVFVSRLDPSKAASAQLVYSTFVGHGVANVLDVDPSGVVTVAGTTWTGFPATKGAYDTVLNVSNCFGSPCDDVFVFRLDPSKTGAAQLVYSTFLDGGGSDVVVALSVAPSGVVTVAGNTESADFPFTDPDLL